LDFIITGGEVADRGYDSNSIVELVEKQGAKPIIPPKKNRIIQRFDDREIYKERHKIENLFGFLKHYRRFFARFDKTKLRFTSFLYFVAALQWLK